MKKIKMKSSGITNIFHRSGGRTKGPGKRTPVEDQVFEETLLRMLKSLLQR